MPLGPSQPLDRWPDPALRRRNILDLGCNAGKLSIECLTHLGASRVVGLDLDPVLMAQAHAAAKVHNLEADPRLKFAEADFMPSGWFTTPPGSTLLPPGEQFDTILLLSITKWLHLNSGDSGLLALFHSLAALLPPGGALVLEPQEWANYNQASRKAKNLRPTFKTLQMRPDFEQELGRGEGVWSDGTEWRGAGLVLERRIEREEGGFSRPLMVWRKP